MFVKWKMSANPFTISPEANIPQAVEIMRKNGVRKLPVVSDGKVVGIISQSDIDRASPSLATSFSTGEVAYLFSKLKVSRVMTRNPFTIESNSLLEEAAIMMRDHRIEILPVVDDGKLVGVITESDLLEAFLELNGAREHGTRLVVEANDAPGVMEKLSSVFSKNSTNITNIAVYRSGLENSLVLLGVNTSNTERLEADLQANGFTVRYRLHKD